MYAIRSYYDDLHAAVTRAFARRKMQALAVPVLILAYLTYVFFAFDIAGIAGRMRPDCALTFLVTRSRTAPSSMRTRK